MPRLRLAGLLLAGLALRLGGVLFNGTQDNVAWIFDWGPRVRALGLARAFNGGGGYGILSFAFAAPSSALAELMPRFWWAPQKFMELGMEAATLAVLVRLLPSDRRHLAVWLYWLNPLFILHGAWQGYWDGPHTLLALVTVWGLRDLRDERRFWFLAALLLAAAAMFKPQGLLYFVLPLSLYLSLEALTSGPRRGLAFGLGLVTVFGTAALFLTIGGGTALAIVKNYLFVARYQPVLCADCISVWRPISKILQAILGQSGPAYALQLPLPVLGLLHGLSLAATGTLLVVFSRRLLAARRASADGAARAIAPALQVLLILACASLVIPQIGTKAHENHTYAALVLLVPIAAASRRVLGCWCAMIAVHLYTQLTIYRFGTAAVAPPLTIEWPNGFPGPLWTDVQRIAATASSSDAILRFQVHANALVDAWLPAEPLLSVLSAVQFVCVVLTLRELFRLLDPRTPGSLARCAVLDIPSGGPSL